MLQFIEKRNTGINNDIDDFVIWKINGKFILYKKIKINTNKLTVIVDLLIGLSVKINKICFHFKTIYIKTKQTVENINTRFFLINVMNIIVLNVEG